MRSCQCCTLCMKHHCTVSLLPLLVDYWFSDSWWAWAVDSCHHYRIGDGHWVTWRDLPPPSWSQHHQFHNLQHTGCQWDNECHCRWGRNAFIIIVCKPLVITIKLYLLQSFAVISMFEYIQWVVHNTEFVKPIVTRASGLTGLEVTLFFFVFVASASGFW